MVKEISGDSYQDFERWNLQIQPPFSQFLAYLVKSDHWLHKILFLQRFWMSRLKNKYCTCIPFLMKGMVYNNVRKIVNYPHTCTCFIIMNQYRFCFTTPIIASNYLKYQSMYSVTIKSILCRTIKSLLPVSRLTDPQPWTEPLGWGGLYEWPLCVSSSLVPPLLSVPLCLLQAFLLLSTIQRVAIYILYYSIMPEVLSEMLLAWCCVTI